LANGSSHVWQLAQPARAASGTASIANLNNVLGGWIFTGRFLGASGDAIGCGWTRACYLL